MELKFVRFQARNPNSRGCYPGIFAIANGLAKDGKFSDKDWTAWRKANDHFDSAYTDPSTVDKMIYDRAINPSAQSWFKRTATDLIASVQFYTDLLDRYGVGWQLLHSDDPGNVLYEDDVQVVVAPAGSR